MMKVKIHDDHAILTVGRAKRALRAVPPHLAQRVALQPPRPRRKVVGAKSCLLLRPGGEICPPVDSVTSS